MPKVLILAGHPDSTSFSSALASAYARAAADSGAEVQHIELSQLAFDVVLRQGYKQEQPLEPDLVMAREAITRADHVAWFFPMWWGAPPALVKGFVERTFTPQFAFRYRGRNQLPEKLLRGRSARLVTSMDCPAAWYTLVNRRSVHAAFAGATLAFVGFSPVRSTTFHELRFMDERARQRALDKVARAAQSDVRAAPARKSAAALAAEGATNGSSSAVT